MSSQNLDPLYLVAVDTPLFFPLTYSAPINSISAPLRGQAVVIPLGKRKVNGIVLGPATQTEEVDFKIKAIESLSIDIPLLPEPTLKWLEWLASYYFYPLGKITSLCLPPLLTKGRGSRKKSALPSVSTDMDAPPHLTEEQSQTLNSISLDQGFASHLIFGVTGSGKTEIYLQLLSKVLRMGKQGLVLVPEISLTPQLLKKFSNRFPQQVAVIHSHLTQRERTEQWWSVIRGEKKILVGARSALFCPLAHLGIIIIDEEHEPSFKQEEKLKYHARDSAIMLAKFHQCPVILGSATPSLESWHNARSGRYHLHILKNRVASRPMPQIEVVNMKQERSRRRLGEDSSHSLPFWLSQNLFEALSETFKQGQQAALFLNRRGIAQTVFCPSCGLTYECPNCSISLTLHGKSQLVCHYCDYHERLRDVCKECHSVDVGPIGLGTELIEQDIRQLFPEIIMARADRDEIQNRQDLEALIENFENHKTQLLIGTQMIAKGLDFKGLNLVGMVMADVGFHLPDFRASERSFQLLVQVSGRAGRHSDTPGRVVIQTYNPDHPSILHAINNQFVEFAEKELQVRNLLHYPPQGRIASFRIQGTQLEKARKASNLLGERCHQLSLHNPTYVPLQILGPAESPLAKLRGKYRFQILIKSPESLLLQRFCRQVIGDQSWIPGGVKVQIDIDPINLL